MLTAVVDQGAEDLETGKRSVPAIKPRSERNTRAVRVTGPVGPPCGPTGPVISGRFAWEKAGITRCRGGGCGVRQGRRRRVDHVGVSFGGGAGGCANLWDARRCGRPSATRTVPVVDSQQ